MRSDRVWYAAAFLLAVLLASHASIQTEGQTQKPPGNLPGNFTFVPKAQIETVQQSILKKETPNDAPVRMVDAGKYNLGVYTFNFEATQPRAAAAPPSGFYHRDIAEVYILTSGSGSWRVGGEVENPTEEPDDRSRREVRGPSVTGTLKGYTTQKLNAGDVLIVGPGVPHIPGEFTERSTVIRVVIDPHKVLPVFPRTSNAPARVVPVARSKPESKLPGAFTYISKADIDKVLKELEKPSTYPDQPVRVIDLPNIDYRVGVYVLHMTQLPKNPTPAKSGWYHTSIAEVYYFMRGAGAFMVGGTLENATADDPNSYSTKVVRGPSFSGTFKDATLQKVEAGDVLIAPTGVPHIPTMPSVVPHDILRIAIDPDHVLPLK